MSNDLRWEPVRATAENTVAVELVDGERLSAAEVIDSAFEGALAAFEALCASLPRPRARPYDWRFDGGLRLHPPGWTGPGRGKAYLP